MLIINSNIDFSIKSELNSRLLKLILFLNALVLVFTDLEFGRTLLLVTAIGINAAIFIYQSRMRIPKYLFFGFVLALYLSLRQIFMLLIGEPQLYSETVSAVLFLIYTISFAILIKNIKFLQAILIARIFIYLNLVFGIPDFFGYDLLFLHVQQNEIFRFRGLATEPNLFALPLLLILFGIVQNEINYKFKKFDVFLCILMIYFTYSKAAYLGIIIVAMWSFIIKKLSFYYFIKISYGFTIFSFFLLTLNVDEYLYKIPFYNNFLSLIDINIILSLGLNEFIIYLTAFDQFQAGSLGTRLATAIASVHTIFSDAFSFVFGVGGGNSHPYLISYILSHGLNNYEINLHLADNPEFITDKTYILKFITEFGFLGYILLNIFLMSLFRQINLIEHKHFFRALSFTTLAMMLTQSQFIFCFIIISLLITKQDK
jgi:hypothetical protein